MSVDDLPSAHVRFAFAMIMLWEDLMSWDEFIDDMVETFGDDYGRRIADVVARRMM